MRPRIFLSAVLVACLVLGGIAWDEVLAQAPWSDNFDSYVAGSQMIGQGGWTGWDNNPAVGALVSNAFSRSNPNSVAITGATDLVHTYAGYTSGRAVYTAWQYIPNNFAGTSYFILLNQYNVGGAKTWSVQVHFESASGRVVSDFDGNWLPLIRGRWVQIRVEINLDTDTQTFYYDNTPLYTKGWRCGVSGCGPLPPNIAAVDLYANGASPVYYDDMSLDHALTSLTLAKTITSGNPYSVVGGTIGYSYTLTNTGNVALFPPYSVTDNQASVTCPAGPAYLSPGASVVCTSSHTVTQSDLNAGSVTNTATATARDAAAGGNAVTSNSSSQTATAVQSPALILAKSITSGNPYSTVGASIIYSYAIRNTGNISLAGPVTVADDRSTDETCPAVNTVGNFDAFLDPGESLTCSASYTVTQADLDAGLVTNTASATAGGTTSNPDSETATATQLPALTVEKSSPTVSLFAPGTVNYSYLVTNSGNVTVTGISLSDDNDEDDLSCPFTTLAPGGTMTCTATHTFTQAELDGGRTLDNNVTASSNEAADATDSLSIPITQNLLIGIAKYMVSSTLVSTGTWDVTYEILVENYGNVALTDLQVTDDLSGTFPLPITFTVQSLSSGDFTENWPGYNGNSNTNLLAGTDTLVVGGSGTITLVVRVIPASAGPFDNTAIASGQPPSGAPVTDSSQDGTDPDNSPSGPPIYNGDGDPTNNNQPTPVSFGPTLFDPPFGIKLVDDNGLPVLRWTMVWINDSNIVAVNAAVSDEIPLGTTYAGSLSCTPAGVTTTSSCIYEAPSIAYPRGRIVWTGTLGPDFGATDAATANNELYIRFNVTVNTGITSVDNLATMDSDLNGDGDLTDPGEQIVATAAANWQVSVLLPDTGFTPGRVTKLQSQPTEKQYSAQSDLWLEIPSQKVKMDIVGVPKVDGEWDVSWLWRDAGYLEGSAFPTYSGNSVITGHVYLPNGLPGPFVDISKLKYGDRITVHAYGQTFIYEVRKVEYLKPTDVSKAFEHKEESWVTLLTCRSYDEKTDSYRQRVAVKAVLVKVIR